MWIKVKSSTRLLILLQNKSGTFSVCWEVVRISNESHKHIFEMWIKSLFQMYQSYIFVLVWNNRKSCTKQNLSITKIKESFFWVLLLVISHVTQYDAISEMIAFVVSMRGMPILHFKITMSSSLLKTPEKVPLNLLLLIFLTRHAYYGLSLTLFKGV